MIAGVCGGLARQLSIDSTWVRLIFVLLAFAGGSGLLIYIVLAIIMPSDAGATVEGTGPVGAYAPPLSPEEEEQRRRRQVEIVGLVLVVIGIIFLASNFGLFSWWRWSVLWPLVLILGGVFLIVRRANR
jgi:phage shock protein C